MSFSSIGALNTTDAKTKHVNVADVFVQLGRRLFSHAAVRRSGNFQTKAFVLHLYPRKYSRQKQELEVFMFCVFCNRVRSRDRPRISKRRERERIERFKLGTNVFRV